MRHTLNLSFALTLATLFLFSEAAFSQAGTCSGMTVGQLTSLNGFVPFQSTSLWNTDISTASVDPKSANYINFIGPTVTLHPDFGANLYQGAPIGIEFVAPSKISLEKINALLRSLDQDAASIDELWPLVNQATRDAA